MMNEELDVYISRNLKNWTASQPLPASGRQRLLKAALNPVEHHNQIVVRPSIWQKNALTPAAYPIHGDRFLGPLAQSQFLSFHLVTSLRLAT